MPKKLWLPREVTGFGSGHSGLDVTWTKAAQRLDFGGCYNCGPRPDVFQPNGIIGVGFGRADLMRGSGFW